MNRYKVWKLVKERGELVRFKVNKDSIVLLKSQADELNDYSDQTMKEYELIEEDIMNKKEPVKKVGRRKKEETKED